MTRNANPGLFAAEPQVAVECLGMKFPSDEARRAYFLEKLREKLKDLEFRKIEGFPIGDDKNILAMSDPPYFTACPNPFIGDFIRSQMTPHVSTDDVTDKEPFAADVSEGKNDPIYNAHSYHTKVPHKAIMRYILHYTEPGQVVFDGFCGTGMTGVAAHLCGERSVVESLGLKVAANGAVLDAQGTTFSHLGRRFAVLSDLSPAATFIAHNYNSPVDGATFSVQSERILSRVEAQCGWMYLTLHNPTKAQVCTAMAAFKNQPSELGTIDRTLPWGTINYTIWSDVFVCPSCSGEVVFWNEALDSEKGEVRAEFPCPQCAARLNKRNMQRLFHTLHDRALGKIVQQAKQIPVLIKYTVGRERFEKVPDEFDRALLVHLEGMTSQSSYPNHPLPKGFNTEQPKVSHGLSHVHHFYTPRNLLVISSIFEAVLVEAGLPSYPGFAFTAMQRNVSRLASIAFSYYFHGGGGAINAGTKGTLYVASNVPEVNVIDNYRGRLAAMKFSGVKGAPSSVTQVASATCNLLPNDSIDYVFTDPPFGGNIMYSELNFLWECWLGVQTSIAAEAIENEVQHKRLADYQRIMTRCFSDYFRVLKPGRWMTVEFHNSQNRVWTAIQEAIQHAGFVVADVRTLDKKQGSFKQYNSVNAVKQDLVISAYKPTTDFESHFKIVAGSEAGAWEFVRSHLKHIPAFVGKVDRGEMIAERQGYLLFDRMVAFHVQRGYSVPISAAEFYAGLRQRYPERDGMYFFSDQVTEYDRWRLEVGEVEQYELFVSDEKTAIQWVRRQLSEQPIRYQQLQPLYMKEAQKVWEKHEQPLELKTILDQNFLEDKEGFWRVPDSKREADLEQVRNRALLKEFQQYLDTKGRLKVVRTEGLRAGFKECWQKKEYATIVQVAKRVPEAVIQEDPALLMYYDNASLLLGE